MIKENIGSLTLIMGPMYAGKTTKLISLALDVINNKIVYKHISDDRYELNSIITHDNKNIKCIPVHTIAEIIYDIKKGVKVEENIFIDEGQFFIDLYDNIDELINMGKNVYISGLNGDCRMEKFGEGDFIKLIPKADKIITLKSKCYICGDDAPFTKKISDDVIGENQILIGSTKIFQSACRKHFHS